MTVEEEEEEEEEGGGGGGGGGARLPDTAPARVTGSGQTGKLARATVRGLYTDLLDLH